MSDSHWAPTLQRHLSQGDVLLNVVIGIPVWPTRFLSRVNLGGGRAWEESESPVADPATGATHFLARGRVTHAIVASHSCELDKGQKRIIVAPITTITSLNGKARDQVLSGHRVSLMSLPNIPDLGDYYADLRQLTVLDRKQIDAAARAASMSEDGQKQLHAQLLVFWINRRPVAPRVP